MFIIILLVFIGVCIYHACEKELPADYHRNWKLEQEDANKVRFGEMSRREFIRNMNNGKYRWASGRETKYNTRWRIIFRRVLFLYLNYGKKVAKWLKL